MASRALRRAALVLVFAPAVHAQEAAPPVRFQTELSRTAIWRGDEFEYRIVLTHHRDVEILQDNLRADSLNLEPFVLIGLETEPRPAAGDTEILELRMTLTLLEAAGREAVIPPLTIYYATRRPGPLGKGTEIETHSLVVPEHVVGVGTTLTRESRDIRDAAGVAPVPPGGRAIWLLGWGMLAAALFQTGRWAFAYYRRRARTRAAPDRRDVERRALERLDRLDTDSGGDGLLAERYAVLANTLQDALTGMTGIQAVNFTPREVREELLRINAGEPLADTVRHLLGECEAVRYRRPDPVEGPGRLGELIRSSREAISELARL